MTRKIASPDFIPIVEIADVEDFRSKGEAVVFGDRRDGKLYRYTSKIKLAINVALATGRPLLILGATGCGKSSLAYNLARVMRSRYYEFIVTSRSQARDLVYRFDAVRRLGDAQLRHHSNSNKRSSEINWKMQFPYLEPGPLWRALDENGAQRRGYPGDRELPFAAAADPIIWRPGGLSTPNCVLLIDEIDKAEPDFPNNLLVPLGSWQFYVDEIGKMVSLTRAANGSDPLSRPLVIITSNQQRELPETFVRRCVVLEIPPPSLDELVELATMTFGPTKDALYKNVACRLQELNDKQVSVAEFLDAVRAIQELKASGSVWAEVIEHSSWRSTEPQ
jgi:MoxR-like ATPase